jgi:gamma-glutamylcyclotransferase (GGCT)/AIG2-like uncharacterized protein YtfP
MPLLFSYGSLRRAEVQQATFGRSLDGAADELAGWQIVPAAENRSPHANVVRVPDARVAGMAFEVSDVELAAADEYERREGYVRVQAQLSSGRSIWVYVDELSSRDPPG